MSAEGAYSLIVFLALGALFLEVVLRLRNKFRKEAERTVEGLCSAIGHLIDIFTPTECANYVAAA